MQRGFSIVEVLIVMTVVTILTGISVFYLSAHERLLRPDEQSLKIIDLLQEARQRALTQRETMRVEIDLSDSAVRLIDENLPTTADDDRVVRSVILVPAAEVRIDARPPDIASNPPEPMPVPIGQFRQSIYPPSVNHTVATFRFQRSGAVVGEGTDAIGSNATTTGATLFVWSPKKNREGESEIARAITIIGATGSIRFWEYNRQSPDANKWKDSRRSN